MKSRSSPSPRRSDWKVWQWALTGPGRSALPPSPRSPGQSRPAGSTAAMRPPSTITARPDFQPDSVSTRSGRSLTRALSSLVDEPAALEDAAHVVHAVVVGEIAPVGNVRQEEIEI